MLTTYSISSFHIVKAFQHARMNAYYTFFVATNKQQCNKVDKIQKMTRMQPTLLKFSPVK